MAKPKKNRNQQVSEKNLEFQIQIHKNEAKARIITTFINRSFAFGIFIGFFYFSSNAIIELAGKETIADIAVNLIADMKVNEWLAYAIGISGLAYGYFERKLRKKSIDRLGPRSANLESLLNPNRTTSGLTTAGETRAEDK